MHDLFKSIVDDFTNLPAKVAAATKANEVNVSNEQTSAVAEKRAAAGVQPSPDTTQPDYRQALADLFALVDRKRDDSWPEPDINCSVCTEGCAPTSGVCAYHMAERLLAVKS